MTPDSFAVVTCSETIDLFHALFMGVPDGVCLSLNITPLGGIAALAALGAGVMCLQMLVQRMFHGSTPAQSARDHDGLSLREIGNRARARRMGGAL